MRRASIAFLVPLLLTLVSGCGSSKKSSSSASQPASSTSESKPAYGGSSTAASTASPAALITSKHSKLGAILAYGPKKLTVYLFEGDKAGASTCAGACAGTWPPVTGRGQVGGQARSADLGTITRPDGSTQVTYKGHPLYLYSLDKDDGDAYGQGIKSFGADWYVLAPSGSKVDSS